MQNQFDNLRALGADLNACSAQLSSTPILQSSLSLPAAPAAFKSSDNAKASIRISSGGTAPALLTDPQSAFQQDNASIVPLTSRTVVLNLTVDASGKTQTSKLSTQPIPPRTRTPLRQSARTPISPER